MWNHIVRDSDHCCRVSMTRSRNFFGYLYPTAVNFPESRTFGVTESTVYECSTRITSACWTPTFKQAVSVTIHWMLPICKGTASPHTARRRTVGTPTQRLTHTNSFHSHLVLVFLSFKFSLVKNIMLGHIFKHDNNTVTKCVIINKTT